MAAIQPVAPAEVPSSTSHPSGVDKDALISRLDALLEQYLHTLDSYEQHMQQLSKQLSSGFFSLTQANFHNRSGVHYGQDSYDERVQATRRMYAISTLAGKEKDKPSPAEDSAKDSVKDSAEDSTKDSAEDSEEDPKPLLEPQSVAAEDTSPPALPQPTPNPSIERHPDPIRMFGILVPPALRTAQSSFVAAVDGPVVRLAGVAGELRALEREIGRVRKGIRRA
ncbi:hypothetical protein SVAN01_05560 [Stagonosporopsis vannaccii]|nr:hypothetical protein SVAN01_05560 [Stagonosporopsis vannaccii]